MKKRLENSEALIFEFYFCQTECFLSTKKTQGTPKSNLTKNVSKSKPS